MTVSVKKLNLVRVSHIKRDVHGIVVLLALGLLLLWTIGPLGVVVVYHVPPLRRFLGLNDPI